MAIHNEFGKEAEEMAAHFLTENGHSVIERNYRFGNCEIDIISLKNNILHIVEVKARSYNYYGEPEEFVNRQKINLLIKAANHYVSKNELDIEVQFDIVSIIKHNTNFTINHIEDAFSFY